MNKITPAPIPAPASPRPSHVLTVATQNVLTVLAAALCNVSVSTAKIAPSPEASTPPTAPSLATEGASSTTNTAAVRPFIVKHPRLLIADDQPISRKLHQKVATDLGFLLENIVVCNNRSEAIQAIQAAIEENKPFGTIFSDRDMGNDTDGDLLAEEVSRLEHPPHFIMISGTRPETLPPGVHFGLTKGDESKPEERVKLVNHLNA